MGEMSEQIGTGRGRYAPGMKLDIPRASAVSIDILPIAAYVCDRFGVLTQYNERAAELWGRNPPLGDREQRFGGALRVYRPDGQQLTPEELPMAEALHTGKAVRDRELILEKPNGERITVIANVNPTFDEDGNLNAAVN
jgi:PAS domain-containing protein